MQEEFIGSIHQITILLWILITSPVCDSDLLWFESRGLAGFKHAALDKTRPIPANSWEARDSFTHGTDDPVSTVRDLGLAECGGSHDGEQAVSFT
jgi:hypothetical protein